MVIWAYIYNVTCIGIAQSYTTTQGLICNIWRVNAGYLTSVVVKVGGNVQRY